MDVRFIVCAPEESAKLSFIYGICINMLGRALRRDHENNGAKRGQADLDLGPAGCQGTGPKADLAPSGEQADLVPGREPRAGNRSPE